MKIYRGTREKSGASVTVNDGTTVSTLDPRLDLRNHSPTGFEWGYEGSGPAQLALAILADHLWNADLAQQYYQDFKSKVIGRFTGEEWTLSSEDIERALQEIKNQGVQGESFRH